MLSYWPDSGCGYVLGREDSLCLLNAVFSRGAVAYLCGRYISAVVEGSGLCDYGYESAVL